MKSVTEVRNNREVAHTRDKGKTEIEALAMSVLDFLETPPAGCRSATQVVLLQGLGMLKDDADAISEQRVDR